MNFFLPCFKLEPKIRNGSKVTKKYERPVTPYERLLASTGLKESQKDALRSTFATLDPVRLLSDIRTIQHRLTQLEVSNSNAKVDAPEQELNKFVAGLSTAWKAGEVRPTHRKPNTGLRPWRTRVDPFERTWPLIEQWLNDKPDVNAKELLERLQQIDPAIPANQLRTLQRSVRQWRTAVARRLVLGAFDAKAEPNKEGVIS